MKLIVLDEADSLYGNADRGAMPAIMELVRHSKQPVILICNDFYGLSKKSSAIKTETFQITFRKPQTASIEKVLMKICAKEHAHVEADAIRIIAENAFSDSDAASFACTIVDDSGATVATANLNAYRPPDMEKFMKEQFDI